MSVPSRKKPTPVKNLGKARKPVTAPQKEEKRYSELQKSGFIKITKSGYLDEQKGKYVAPKYTVTPKGEKNLKDTKNAYAKDPMNLRPKKKATKTKKLGA
jgi:hypothetical protein